jgi:hypothetical protein
VEGARRSPKPLQPLRFFFFHSRPCMLPLPLANLGLHKTNSEPSCSHHPAAIFWWIVEYSKSPCQRADKAISHSCYINPSVVRVPGTCSQTQTRWLLHQLCSSWVGSAPSSCPRVQDMAQNIFRLHALKRARLYSLGSLRCALRLHILCATRHHLISSLILCQTAICWQLPRVYRCTPPHTWPSVTM